jgi:hypothetical protein
MVPPKLPVPERSALSQEVLEFLPVQDWKPLQQFPCLPTTGIGGMWGRTQVLENQPQRGTNDVVVEYQDPPGSNFQSD